LTNLDALPPHPFHAGGLRAGAHLPELIAQLRDLRRRLVVNANAWRAASWTNWIRRLVK
jgi:hypothetical protein